MRYVYLLPLLPLLFLSCQEKDPPAKPNIIFIMADDLGYGDLGCYGQQVIKTPHLDALAENGLRFVNFYSGSPVCAPARSVLMTGQHTGHTTVRGNFGIGGVIGLGGGEGRVPLKSEDTTVAEVLKAAGYLTAITGKWGLGEPGTTGLPNDQGFDEWFGYLNQRRAHNHYAEFIWHNSKQYEIPENNGGREEVYTHHLFTDFALNFISDHAEKEQPFFLYIPYLLPHSDYQIPEINELYEGEDWTRDEKVHASMVTLIDSDVGRIQNLLKEMDIDKNTILIFTSDNGAAERWDARFDSSGKLKGRKRDVYEGGIRVPLIVSQPGRIPAGKVNQTIGSFIDILPTFADLAGVESPKNKDGISLKNALLKNEEMAEERLLYWEFHEESGKQAVRQGKWKAIRLYVHDKGFHQGIELYNLESDPEEATNIVDQFPAVAARLLHAMDSEHRYSDNFPFRFEVN